jgi:hypothetical protein
VRFILLFALCVFPVVAGEFGHPGGPAIANADEMVRQLQAQPYDFELMLSFGTSKFGSGGHLAVAVREGERELVYSANFYADRSPKHADHFTRDLMCIIPKGEYLFGVQSTLDAKASFGLDYGEVFKRSVIGIRAAGATAQEKAAVVAFMHRLNDDYRRDLPSTDYHSGRIAYGYTDLNCAKTVGVAFKHGAGYEDLKIKGTGLLGKVNPLKALKANVPMEMAMKIVTAWGKRGYRMDAVLYKKWEGSTYPDGATLFKDLPNRFPSILSLDYAEDSGGYEDYDNLRAAHLLHNIGRCSVAVDPATRQVRIDASQEPMDFAQAAGKAEDAAGRDSKMFIRRLFHSWGVRIGAKNDNTHLYRPDEPGEP